MKRILYVHIPGVPIGKGRGRHYTGHVVTPGKTRRWEKIAAEMIQTELHTAPRMNKQPLQFIIRAKFHRDTKDAVAWWKRALLRLESLFVTKRPDLDNIIKIVLDAFNGAKINGEKVADDAVVAVIHSIKYYVADNEADGVSVWIDRMELTDTPDDFMGRMVRGSID
jgi:Holliday junction resolvase RusA-like endonuclease